MLYYGLVAKSLREHVISSKKLFLFFLLTASTYVSLVIDNAYAHIPQDNNTSPRTRVEGRTRKDKNSI